MAGEDDKDSRTEEATPHKVDKAKEDGDILMSQEVKMAGQLLGAAFTLWLLLPFIAGRVKTIISGHLENVGNIRLEAAPDLLNLAVNLSFPIGSLVGIALFAILAAGVAATVAQTGFRTSSKKLLPDISRISPIAGWKRLFSMQSLMEFLKSVAKIATVGFLSYLILRPKVDQLESLVSQDVYSVLGFMHHQVVVLCMFVVALVALIAVVDWLYQRHAYLKKLRMTRQEVKDEYKQTEGDPMVRARLRSIRMSRARQRMMAAIPTADVVVTNPTHFACALKYDADKMRAPVLVAKGQDFMAQKIREAAKEHKVPIMENAPLARALYASVDIDKEIPQEHYKAVAEVISYVMRLREKKR